MPSRAILPAVALLLIALSVVRPIDHDESQYVAAAVLSAKGLLPYRDYAYLQVPLQPLLFAPVAALADAWAWPALRLLNAALGAVAVAGVFAAARRGGAGERAALVAALGFGSCDILLFSAGTARNDALPAALLSMALVVIADRAPTRRRAALAGVLLAAAAAAKISYALPAAAYGLWTLRHRACRPAGVAAGAMAPLLLVGWTWWHAPDAFAFGVFTFPAQAPADFYADRPWKLSLAAKAIDTLKFLALGPALIAALVALRDRRRADGPWPWLAAAGLAAALLPEPTWRQYLLPMLPPLFVAAAYAIDRSAMPRAIRRAVPVFVAAGLAPSLVTLAGGVPGLPTAMRESAAIRTAMDGAAIDGPVATLAPQFLPATGRAIDPRFATGPFAFRIRRFLSATAEAPLILVTPRSLAAQFDAWPPAAILTGGEGEWTSGDDGLERPLGDWARRAGWRRIDAGRRFRLWVPQATRKRRAVSSVS